MTEAAAAEVAEKPAPGSLDLIQHHAQIAQANRDAELEAEGIEPEDNADERLNGKADKESGRDEKGKFVAKTKEAAEPAKAEPAPKEKPAAAEPAVAESLTALQKLVNEGKIADALKAIGLDEKGPNSKQWEAFRKDAVKERTRVEKQAAEVRAAYQNVERVAAGLEQQHGRFRAAQAAYQAGDFDAAFQHAFGEDLNSFQQKAIQRLATRDPEVARLRQEMQQRDQRDAQMRAQQEAAAAERELVAEREGYLANLGKELTELDDPRIPRAAGRKDFVQRVFAVQAKHYNARSDSTISTREAAEKALAELESEYSELRSVFDGEGGAAKPARPSTGVKPGAKVSTRPVSPARQSTHLRQQEAAEPHVSEPLRGKALIQKHVRMTLANLKREQEGAASE
jgi:hypothetical protein